MAFRRRNPMQKAPYTAPDVQPVQIPVPTGGWDAISPLAAMDPQYAPILDNWVPRPGYIELRRGYSAWCQNLGGAASPVETLMTFRNSVAGTERLFAATNHQLWEVSTQGIPTLTTAAATTSNRMQYLNFTPPLGTPHLCWVNGSDPFTTFDGTNWVQQTITGVSSSTFISINAFKERLWFAQANSTVFWFLGTGAISGAATAQDIGPFIKQGGQALCMANWTIDGGSGPDDYAAFITTRGEVVLYKGTDPTNANAWQLIGTFQIPPVLGNRPFCQLGAELGIITIQGVMPISRILAYDSGAQRSVAITSRIQNAMMQAGAAYQNNFGWQLVSFPAQGFLILNVPIAANSMQVQYVMNQLNGAWFRITGWNANCFEIFNDNLYFGDNTGNVNWAWQGAADLVAPISADMQCAYNWFGQPGRLKRMTMVQPLIYADGTITPTMAIDTDFLASSTAANVAGITQAGGIWDVSKWDVAQWASGPINVTQWIAVTMAPGHALAVRMKVNFLPAGAGNNSVFDSGVFDTMLFDGFGTTAVTMQINGFNALVEYGGQV